MRIYSPMANCFISQKYNENKACINRQGHVVGKRGQFCPAGYTDFYKSIGMDGHNGYDFSCPYKEKVYHNVLSGSRTWTVKYDGDMAGGVGLDLYSDTPVIVENFSKVAGPEALAYYDGRTKENTKDWYDNESDTAFCYVKTRHWHLQRYVVENGATVRAGDLIALADSTGASSNHHDHFGVKIVTADGVTLDTGDGNRVELDDGTSFIDSGNGYYGAIDFTDMYVPQFVLDVLKKKTPSRTLSETLYLVGWKFSGTRIQEIFEKVGQQFEA